MITLLLTVPLDALLNILSLLAGEGLETAITSEEGVLQVTVAHENADAAKERLSLLGSVVVAGGEASAPNVGEEAPSEAAGETAFSEEAASEEAPSEEASSEEPAEPVPVPPVSCVLHLWGEDSTLLIERGQALFRDHLMGKILWIKPQAGFVDGHWTLSFTTEVLEEIGVAVSEIPVSWALYVDGAWAAGTEAPEHTESAESVGSAEGVSPEAAPPEASGSSSRKRNRK